MLNSTPQLLIHTSFFQLSLKQPITHSKQQQQIISIHHTAMAYLLHRSAAAAVPGSSTKRSAASAPPRMRVSAAASSSVLRCIQQSVAGKQQSAVEVTQQYLQQLKSVEGQVNAFLTVNEEAALAQVGEGPSIGFQ